MFLALGLSLSRGDPLPVSVHLLNPSEQVSTPPPDAPDINLLGGEADLNPPIDTITVVWMSIN